MTSTAPIRLIQEGFAKFREMILNPDKTVEDQEISESVAANTGSESAVFGESVSQFLLRYATPDALASVKP